MYVVKRLDQEMMKEFGVGYPGCSKKPEKSEALRNRRAEASAESDVWDQVSEVDPCQELEMHNSTKLQQVEEQMLCLNMENKNLASRTTNIEMKMQELFHHMRQLSVKSESWDLNGSESIHAAMQDSLPDLDFEFMPSPENQSFRAKINRFVQKFSKELHDVVQNEQAQRRCLPSRLDLLEVMCSEQSELTPQVRKLGGRAQRFGRVQGDRRRLFVLIATSPPEHIWISPECGPWCQWS